MEILKFLLDFFTKNQEGGALKTIFEILEKNSFDIKRVINNFSIDDFMPIIEGFLGQIKKPDESVEPRQASNFNPSPVRNFCNEEIYLALSSHLGI